MFGFKKTSELDRLRTVYAGQTDNELLRLHDDREGLTEAAQQALDEVMQQRGLESDIKEEPAAVPIKDPLVAQQGEPAEGLSPGEVELWTFADTYQLQSLIDLLEETSIGFRLLDASKVQWAGLRSRTQLGMTVIVEEERAPQARSLLRQVLFAAGLDREDPSELSLTPPAGLVLLLTCGRTEALEVVRALSDAGLSFYWRDGREDIEVPGEDVIAFEVHAVQRERADEVVRAWVASRPLGDQDEHAAEA